MIYPPSRYHYECIYEELKELSTHPSSQKKLPKLQSRILQFMARHYSISSFELSKNFSYSRKPMDRDNAKKCLRNLRELDLIELDHEKIREKKTTKGHATNYYKLSKYGVYSIIINNENLQFEITKHLILEYRSHVLFGFFLFPYIKQETLVEILDSDIFYTIFPYLHNCCKQFEDTLQMIKQTYNQENGYLTSQLLVWHNVPGVSSDTESLLTFLKEKFGWKWMSNARINKTEDGNGMTISYGQKTALISVDKKSKRAKLSFRGKRLYEFIIRELGAENFALDIPTQPLEEYYLRSFLISHILRIPNFILSLIPLYGTPDYIPPFIEILAQDKRFVQALGKVKSKFDETYELFLDIEGKSLR